jgi:hypothetical protein
MELVENLLVTIHAFQQKSIPVVIPPNNYDPNPTESYTAMCLRMCPVVEDYDELLCGNTQLLDACLDRSVEEQNVHNTMKLMSIRLQSLAR